MHRCKLIRHGPSLHTQNQRHTRHGTRGPGAGGAVGMVPWWCGGGGAGWGGGQHSTTAHDTQARHHRVSALRRNGTSGSNSIVQPNRQIRRTRWKDHTNRRTVSAPGPAVARPHPDCHGVAQYCMICQRPVYALGLMCCHESGTSVEGGDACNFHCTELEGVQVSAF